MRRSLFVQQVIKLWLVRGWGGYQVFPRASRHKCGRRIPYRSFGTKSLLQLRKVQSHSKVFFGKYHHLSCSLRHLLLASTGDGIQAWVMLCPTVILLFSPQDSEVLSKIVNNFRRHKNALYPNAEEGSQNHGFGFGHLRNFWVSLETLVLPTDSLMASWILSSFQESIFSRIQSIVLSAWWTYFNTKITDFLLLCSKYWVRPCNINDMSRLSPCQQSLYHLDIFHQYFLFSSQLMIALWLYCKYIYKSWAKVYKAQKLANNS